MQSITLSSGSQLNKIILILIYLSKLSQSQRISLTERDYYVNDRDNFIFSEPEDIVVSLYDSNNGSREQDEFHREVFLDQHKPPVAEVFITRGNTEETIPLSEGSGTSRDILVTEEMVRNGSEFNHLVLLCNASYPVEWIYEGVGAPRLYTTQIRTFGNFFDPNTYGHSSIVVLVQERCDEQQTGSYTCRGVDKYQLSTRFHIYFKGEFGFPSLQNEIVQPEENDTSAILPCPTSDPTAVIGLFKVAPPKESKNLTLHESFSYDPQKGFVMKLKEHSNPYGSYVCKYKGMDSFWKIDLVPAKNKEIQVIPNSEMVEMNNHADHSFTCRAKQPILLTLPNTVDFGTIEYAHNVSLEFPYSGILTITPHVPLYSVANYFKVNCMLKETMRVLHSWQYSNFGKDELKINYDKNQKRLLCCSKSGLTPIHELAKCETVTDCNIKKNCFKSGRCDYAFPPKFVDAPRGCTALEFMDDFPSHIMQCSVGRLRKTMMVTSNVDNNALILYDGTMPETDRILKMTVLRQNGNEVVVRCVASIFFFSTNIIFGFERADGSFDFADESQIENENSYGPILHAIVGQNVRKIHCFAPLTRAVDWRTVSLNVNGTEVNTVEVGEGEEVLPVTSISINQDPYEPYEDDGQEPDRNNESEDKTEEQVLTSIRASTSVQTALRTKGGHLIKVIQDI